MDYSRSSRAGYQSYVCGFQTTLVIVEVIKNSYEVEPYTLIHE